METVIEILIDISASMGTMKGQGVENENKNLLPDGSTRISLAKKFLIEELVPTIDYASRVIIRTFFADHSKGGEPDVTILFDGDFDRELIIKELNEIPDDTPVGGTPITAAVIKAINNLKSDEYLNFERLIFLVTDGEENGKGDYTVALEEAKNKDGIICKVHIVGISLDAKAEEKAQQLSNATHGIYLPLKAKNYNPDEIKRALAPLKINVLKKSIENIKSQNDTSNFNPLVSEKIETLENKLEKIEKENQYHLLHERFDLIESTFQEMEVKLQKQLGEITASFETYKVSEAIDALEKKLSKQLNLSALDIKQVSEKMIIQAESSHTVATQNIEKLIGDVLKITLESKEWLTKQIAQLLPLEKKLNDLILLQQHSNKINNKQQINFYITWILILLVVIVNYLLFKGVKIRH